MDDLLTTRSKQRLFVGMSRRQVLGWPLVAVLPTGSRAQEQVTTFEMTLPVALMPQLRQDTNYAKWKVSGDPQTVDPTKGLPLIYIAVGLLLLPDLARSLMTLYRDYKYGGTVIEVNKGKLLIKHDDKLDADTIVVKDVSGKVTIHRNRNAASMEKWTELLVSAGAKP